MTLLWTIIAAAIILGLVVVAFSIGRLLTGKSRLKKRCGFQIKKGDKNEESCHICGSKSPCDTKDQDKDAS